MNILFVLYNDFTANSASHIRCFADELGQLGHDCCVAVPSNKQTVACLGPVTFRCIEFPEIASLRSAFSDGRGPDIVHAWTPREIVRKFCQSVMEQFRCRLFIHLEDNEWHILSCFLNRSVKELFGLGQDRVDELIQPGLSHPHRAVDFMGEAEGITVIIDRLAELSPSGIPTLELWPSADPRLFSPGPIVEHQRNALGVAQNTTLIAYTGNVHAANAHEIRSLYLAVAILNREGFPTTLVRAGRDYYPFLGPSEDWARRYAVDLGMVPHVEIGSILRLADLLVQPGKSDNFNDYRFPSKLPEFLSVGRPVILPNANIAKYMTHREHAFILDDPSAVAIANAVREVISDRLLYKTLSAGSLQFFRERLSWAGSALKLHDFYMKTGSAAAVNSRATHA